MPDQIIEIMQDIASQINKSQRELYPITDIINRNIETPLGDNSQRDARKWLSPPDPWENHDTARESHHKGTSRWFVQSKTFAEWKSSGPNSLLWIHGKRGCPSPARICWK